MTIAMIKRNALAKFMLNAFTISHISWNEVDVQ